MGSVFGAAAATDRFWSLIGLIGRLRPKMLLTKRQQGLKYEKNVN